jgi:hypothetical protein
MPTGIIVFAVADAGRVWAEGEQSSRVHTAGGGGVRLSFFEEEHGEPGDRFERREHALVSSFATDLLTL